ncbi:uncharacterized protein PV06_10719 [Exophiala oligosperma]|uniref:Uncharacterized protein n=1 Tax=Exophiala oligosperma TaxID=215243 RepID=A0A0D2BI49_9EURO|nr:uncharacterized protein PV06_10719 [Exophiala oligosperma]KIW37092.1 hypothetical protein PV06_10719 [Exophiala oligosperma]
MSYLHRLRSKRGSDDGVMLAVDVADLQSAVDLATEAIDAYPGEGFTLSMYEDQLVLCLNHAYHASSANSDKLPLAIHYAENAVSRADEDDSVRGKVLRKEIYQVTRNLIVNIQVNRDSTLKEYS